MVGSPAAAGSPKGRLAFRHVRQLPKFRREGAGGKHEGIHIYALSIYMYICIQLHPSIYLFSFNRKGDWLSGAFDSCLWARGGGEEVNERVYIIYIYIYMK